jgi:hypothetical protein
MPLSLREWRDPHAERCSRPCSEEMDEAEKKLFESELFKKELSKLKLPKGAVVVCDP